jgi:hypothetical protein
MAVQEFCRSPEQAMGELKANFSGFLAESQQTITAAINDLSEMSVSDAKRSEAKACLIQERKALNTLSKALTKEQFNAAGESLGNAGLKFAEFKNVSKSFAKAHLAATSGVLYSAIKMDELKGHNIPDKEALPLVKYMDQQHKFVQLNMPDYKFSKSQRFVAAIHNFYFCGSTSTNDTASKSRDNSKESMVPQQNEKYRNSSYRAGKS